MTALRELIVTLVTNECFGFTCSHMKSLSIIDMKYKYNL